MTDNDDTELEELAALDGEITVVAGPAESSTDPLRDEATPEELADLERVEAALDTRWPESKIDPTLEREQALVEMLGQPQHAYPVIHVAGTNGKTSTARMIDALLAARGMRVGRTTSPHLTTVRERISLDGAPISPHRFVEVYDDVAPYLEIVDGKLPVALSYFEVLTAMGFVAFADAPVDVAVVEVGMGGTWDSTNVADGQIAVITPIGYDHTHILGDRLSQIAGEKAGIIKPGRTAILAAQETEAATVLLAQAAEMEATVAREDMEFGVLERRVAVGGQVLTLQGLGGQYDGIFLPLHGAHQAENAGLALAAVEAFFGVGLEGPTSLPIESIRTGFASVRSPGRLETVRTSPTIVVDAAHNPHGMAASVAAVSESFTFTRLVGIFAAVGDKDVSGMLELLEPLLDAIVISENSSPRRMSANRLAGYAVDIFGEQRVTVAKRLPDAIEAAVTLAEEDEIGQTGAGVLITGSVITAGDARALLGAR
ncbi:MAG: bifunctional folylpolyglutamate synthase/dihydrofolate synthase [Mycobacteriales bacterium]